MSPSPSPSRTPYKSPRQRRELLTAILGVIVVLAFTVAMVFVLAPETEEPAPLPPAASTIPVSDPTATLPASTVPGETTTVPATAATTAPASSSPSSSAPAG